MTITVEEVRASLDYDPNTGIFTRKERPDVRGNVRWRGAPAGSLKKSNGYVEVSLKLKKWYAHRLAWFYVHGEWPDGQIDHKNGIRTDNRIENLRIATPTQNAGNSRGYSKMGIPKGVAFQKNATKRPWMAQIKIKGKLVYLGCYTTPEEAHAAYCAKAREVHGEFARFD